MNRLPRANLVLASVAAFIALSLSMPASADGTYQSGARSGGAGVPTPRAHPVHRTRATRSVHYRLNPPYERIAAQWPILFVGIGW